MKSPLIADHSSSALLALSLHWPANYLADRIGTAGNLSVYTLETPGALLNPVLKFQVDLLDIFTTSGKVKVNYCKGHRPSANLS